jgi:peptide subunit release factor 1 (eRF1)
MHVSAPERDELRHLADIRLDRPVVLSLYLDLDPTDFATPPARATAARSLLDEAERRVREQGELEGADRQAVESSLERARQLLERELPAEGTRAVALFACEPAELFTALRLPRPVGNRVAIDRSPLIGPLARVERRERWCVALVSRRDARIFRGSPHDLREIEQIHDTVFGQHDQGGWSQARFQRGIEKEKDDHLRHVAEALMRHHKRRPFQHLLVGGPREVAADFEGKLHGYLSALLAGRIEVDVDTATPDQVLAAAAACFQEVEDDREAKALELLGEGQRSAIGLEAVLRALNERRVETLLLDERFSAAGSRCPECGWLGLEGLGSCPLDGHELERLDDVTDAAIELTVQQAAGLLGVSRRSREFAERCDGAAALLRF